MKYIKILAIAMLTLPIVANAENGKGMTWGFAAWTDIKSGETSIPHSSTAKIGCNTSPGNNSTTNPAGLTAFSIQDWQSPTDPNHGTDNGSRLCNAYKGDTSCTKKRHVLCIAETNNPYLHRQPPYNNPNSTDVLAPYFGNTPPPYNRKRYKIHHQAHSMPKEFYAGWVDQPVKLSKQKILGTTLNSPAAGDAACGPGWRMAEFHDGKNMPGMDYNVPNTYGNNWNPTKSGGWAFHAILAPDFNSQATHANTGSNRRTTFMRNRYWVKSNTTNANCWN